jgi:transposase-like protein
LFNPSKRARRLVAADEPILKINGNVCYLGAATDMDAREIGSTTPEARRLYREDS